MTSFPRSPRLVKSGLVLADPETAAIRRVIPFQYNPEALTRTLQVRGGTDAGGGAEPLRIHGPPVETVKLDAILDATDRLEQPDQHPETLKLGIQPQIAALETILYPASSRMQENYAHANGGSLEIVPVPGPLVLFVWSRDRVVPVRLTEFSVVEEAFDPSLNPIRAKVSLGLRVLSTEDLSFGSRGGSLYMIHQQRKEHLARLLGGGSVAALGIGGLS